MKKRYLALAVGSAKSSLNLGGPLTGPRQHGSALKKRAMIFI